MSWGMVMEFFVHALDKGDDSIPNSHFHMMCLIRLLDEHGRWSNKQRREYLLDDNREWG